MHWSEQIASQLINNNPKKEEFVLAAGISPSGTVHIGNFRDVATIYFVAKALQDKGKKTKLLFSWDEYDRFRKVPKNIPENMVSKYEEYIGKPYSEVPDPFGCHSTYAEHYEKEFESSLEKIGMKFDIIKYQSKEYLSGRYRDGILTALKKRKEIYDILQDFKTQDASDEERESYYPISIYCDKCGKDNTEITGASADYTVLDYKCTCGHAAKINLCEKSNFKLAWKIDWPMRWMYEKVDFEPGGKDHASPQGSYQVSRIIAKKIYDINEPLFQGYEFIGIKGLTGKMSGSSGLNINLEELLKIYPAELVWWLFAKKAPNEAFDISLGDDVPRIYNEFDKIFEKYLNDDGITDDPSVQVMDMVIEDKSKYSKDVIPFSILSTLYSIANENVEMIKEMLGKIEVSYTLDGLLDRLAKVSYWLQNYSPDMIIKVRTEPDFEFFDTLDDKQKGWVLAFNNLAKLDLSPGELTTKLYEIPKEDVDEKTNKSNQLAFFKIMYKLLIGRDRGPMLSTLIIALGAKNILPIVEPLVSDKK
jgi:lysyl-tRNA synthetase class 1